MNKEYKILVVDDSPSIREMIKYSLLDAGFRVETAELPDEAFNVLEATNIDLVVCDILLKSADGQSGYHLLKRIKGTADLKHIPVILISSKRKEIIARVTATRLGAADFLKKPFEMNELINRIHQLLGNQQVNTN